MANILVVCPRFLPNSAGGAEKLALDYCLILKEFHQITVATTCASDYITWKNEYPVGTKIWNQIVIQRFKNKRARNIKKMNILLDTLLNSDDHVHPSREDAFLEEQGPFCPDLVEYIIQKQVDYDLIIFVGYLYYPIVASLPKTKKPVIIIPTFHDEPVIHLPIYKKIFLDRYTYFFNSPEEAAVYQKIWNKLPLHYELIGTYIDPPSLTLNPSDQKEGFTILTIGRMEPAKGFPELFQYFKDWIKISGRKDVYLHCLGNKSNLELPKHPQIIYHGFVGEEAKEKLLRGADLYINPSSFESFSISLMEAWNYKIPALVNGNSDVLKNHILRSQGGLYYHDILSFQRCMYYLLSHSLIRKRMGDNGRQYVDLNFRREIIAEKITNAVNTLLG